MPGARPSRRGCDDELVLAFWGTGRGSELISPTVFCHMPYHFSDCSMHSFMQHNPWAFLRQAGNRRDEAANLVAGDCPWGAAPSALQGVHGVPQQPGLSCARRCCLQQDSPAHHILNVILRHWLRMNGGGVSWVVTCFAICLQGQMTYFHSAELQTPDRVAQPVGRHIVICKNNETQGHSYWG